MCCSKQDWAEKTLKELRDIFIAREYPQTMVETEIEKVKKLSRRDLIFKQKEKAKNTKYRTSLIVEHHPENPPFRKWIKEGMKTLHINPALRKLFPEIPIVTRQGKNVGRLAIKARHWRSTPGSPSRGEGLNMVKHGDTYWGKRSRCLPHLQKDEGNKKILQLCYKKNLFNKKQSQSQLYNKLVCIFCHLYSLPRGWICGADIFCSHCQQQGRPLQKTLWSSGRL